MTTHSKNQNRRDYLRIPNETTLTVTLLEYPLTNTNSVDGTIKNISEKGVCFIASTTYHPKTLLNLKIELRGWQQYLTTVSSIVDVHSLTKPLTTIAEVMWSKEIPESNLYEIGVCFMDIYIDEYQALVRYLEVMKEASTS